VKKRLFAAGVALLTFVMVLFSASIQHSQPVISQLVVFGDSLSDTGNVFRASGGVYPPNPPYFQGRYSNGPVWVEYLANKLNLTVAQSQNFALGGATTGNSSINGLPGALSQVQTFTATHPDADPHALYILWAGANDYLYGAADPTVAIANLEKSLQSLASIGAQKILVANLPDLGQVPATRNDSNARSLSDITRKHNQNLERLLTILERTLNHTQIVRLDVGSLYRDAIAHPSQFGFSNVTQACFEVSACPHPNQFLFWDGIHPTTAAHRILGDAAFETLQTRVFIAP
jgi:phospholipase/lecithinase/hemolysin